MPVQVVGLVALLPALLFVHGAFSREAIVAGVGAGVCGAIGLALLYHALAIGKMGVVSPVTAVLAAALPVFAGILRGERLHALHSGGIVLALVAVVMISIGADEHGKYELSAAGLKEACASGVMLGLFLIFLGSAPHGSGIYPLIVARAASAVLLVAIALALRAPFFPRKGVRRMTAAGGVLDAGANALYVAATQIGLLSTAAVVTSLYPAATVIMARVFLGEKLQIWQTAGVACALAGVAMISS